jgi:hypothetical protein
VRGYWLLHAGSEYPTKKRKPQKPFYSQVEGFCDFMEKIIEENEYHKVVELPDHSVKIIKKKEKESGKKSWWFRITRKRWFNDWEELTTTQRSIMLSLCLYAGSRDFCYPSIRELSVKLSLSTQTTGLNTKKLEKSGFIRIEKQKGRGRYFNKYYLLK